MPGISMVSPPPPFLEACRRWACGLPTPYDNAVLHSLTTLTPLAEPHDPLPVGFLSTTRLPPPSLLPLYLSTKDEIRASFHQTNFRSQSEALTQELGANCPPGPPLFPTHLGAIPARRGLGMAMLGGVGKKHPAKWSVERALLQAAGGEFVTATKKCGWNVQIEEEGLVAFIAGEKVNDWELVKWGSKLMQGEKDILPGGKPDLGDGERDKAARITGVPGVWLKLRVAWGRLGIQKSIGKRGKRY